MNLLKLYLEKLSISYNAIILNDLDKIKLYKNISSVLNDEEKKWKVICDHSTITLGKCELELKKFLNTKQWLTVTHYGRNDKAFSVKIEYENKKFDIYQKNPHITCLVSKDGKAKDGNNIINWIKFDKIFKINGIFNEVYNK